MAGEQPSATASADCWLPPAGTSPASFTTTMPGSRSTIWHCQCRHAASGLGPDDDSWPEDGYRGDYINEVAAGLPELATGRRPGPTLWSLPATPRTPRRSGASPWPTLRREQDLDLKAFAVHFDNYFPGILPVPARRGGSHRPATDRQWPYLRARGRPVAAHHRFWR